MSKHVDDSPISATRVSYVGKDARSCDTCVRIAVVVVCYLVVATLINGVIFFVVQIEISKKFAFWFFSWLSLMCVHLWFMVVGVGVGVSSATLSIADCKVLSDVRRSLTFDLWRKKTA